jgi:hypothetical protein
METGERHDAPVRFFDLDPLFQWRIFEMVCCFRGALGREHRGPSVGDRRCLLYYFTSYRLTRSVIHEIPRRQTFTRF